MTARKTPAGLKQIEKYNLMKWVDAHRDEALEKTDAETAEQLRDELDIPHLTEHHVAGARRSLGIMKPRVVPVPPAGTLADLRELAWAVAHLAIAVRKITDFSGRAIDYGQWVDNSIAVARRVSGAK